MAESFVNTFKRDYVSRMDLRNTKTVMTQLPAAFEHFNEVHPHSSLKMRAPRARQEIRIMGSLWSAESRGNINAGSGHFLFHNFRGKSVNW